MSSSFGRGFHALMQGSVQRVADSTNSAFRRDYDPLRHGDGVRRDKAGGVGVTLPVPLFFGAGWVRKFLLGLLLWGLVVGVADAVTYHPHYYADTYDAWNACYAYKKQCTSIGSWCEQYAPNLCPTYCPGTNQFSEQSAQDGSGNVWFGCSPHGVGTTCPQGYTVDANTGICLGAQKTLGAPAAGQCTGNACNSATGNKYQMEEDYRGGDGSLSYTRSYNSQANEGTALGFNWTSSFEKRLEISGSQVQIRRADGRGELFGCFNTPGSCLSDSDTHLSLTKDSSGYTLALRNGATERYDTTGNLQYEMASSGQKTNYAHANGTLATVTDAFGHALTFAYTNNYVSTVTDPAGNPIGYTYDSNNNLTRVNYPDSTAKIYYYENSAFPYALTGIAFVDASNTTTRFSTYGYDATTGSKAILTQHAQTDNGAPQEKFSLTYNSATQTTVIDPVGTQEVMTFSTNLGVKNLVSKTTSIDAKTFTQAFDGNNNLICRKDEEGHVTTYTYNSTNQRLSMTEGLAGDCSNLPSSTVSTNATRTISYQYVSTTLDLPTVITSPSVYPGQSKTTTIQYTDASHPNLPTIVTQSGYAPSGTSVSRTVTLGYNTHGQVNSIDGPRTDVADVTALEYYDCTTGGACGQLKKLTNAVGQITTYDSYDANGRLLQMTDPNGLVTAYGYDPRGRVTSITRTPASGPAALWQYGYTPWGDVAQVTDPDGVVLTYGYDAAHYLRTVTDNAGDQLRYKYDLKGNRTQDYTYDPSATLVRQIDIAYDLRNHVSSINAAGSLTQQVYDAVGNLTREVDPKNNPATTHGYDALNRLIQTVDALSGITGYGYDVNNHPNQVTAPNNATTQYSYDDLGNLLQEVSADRGTTNYSYDAAGNVISKTDARGIVAAYTYDALNRVTSIDYPGTAEDVSYTYDAGPNCTSGVGRLCQVVDASGTTRYGYDAFGNVIQQQKTELGVTYVTGYSYSAANRLTAITYPDQRQVTYSRDAVGRISAVSVTINGSNQTVVSNRTYRADGLLLTQTYGNGLNETRTYDLQGRFTNQALGTADTRVYGFDANGNLTSLQDSTQTGSYGYDALDRLIQDSITSSPSSSTSFGYDANGNRQSDAGGTYIYLSTTNRLSQYYGQAVTLDAAGNTVNDGTYTYAYNNAGELQSVSQGSTLGSYVYNHERQRTQKTTAAGTTVYHYDLAGHLITETQANGTPIRAYVWADQSPIAQVSSGSPETLVYLHSDHEGAPRLATDANQAVVWRYEGRAFGDTAPTGTITVNLRLPGMYADAETGLYYNMARYYDPGIGRYISSDPIGLKGGLNTYLYASANPLRYVDPTGLDWIYSQSTGQLSYQPPASLGGGPPQPIWKKGYSGNGPGLNNPAMQNKSNVGPIPQGAWDIGPQGMHYAQGSNGQLIPLPHSMSLTPEPGTNTFGRGGFLIHGDTSCGCHNASNGCVVLPLPIRNLIGSSGDKLFRVVP